MTKSKQTFSISETAEILVPDKFGRTSYLMSILLCVAMLAVITVIYGKLPVVVPLFFTLPWGEARLASKMLLYMLPIILLVFLIINLFLGRISAKLSPMLPQVLAVSTAVIASMMMIALVGIVQSLIL